MGVGLRSGAGAAGCAPTAVAVIGVELRLGGTADPSEGGELFGEEGGGAAGVEEDYGAVMRRFRGGNETGHAFAGVEGIEDKGFGAGGEADRAGPFR